MADEISEPVEEGAPEGEATSEPSGPDLSFIGTPEFERAVQQAASGVVDNRLQNLIAEATASGERPEGDEGIDFLGDPTEVQQGITQLVNQVVEQRLASIAPAVEHMQGYLMQDRVEATLGDVPAIKEITELYPEDQRGQVTEDITRAAFAFLPETERLYGEGSPQALDAALRAAAERENVRVKSLHAAGYAARNAELQNLGGARTPAPAASGPAQILDEPKDELEAAARYAARHGLD